MPRFEATIRHTLATNGEVAAVDLATKLCQITRSEAELYLAQLRKSRAADTIANHPSMKWDET